MQVIKDYKTDFGLVADVEAHLMSLQVRPDGKAYATYRYYLVGSDKSSRPVHQCTCEVTGIDSELAVVLAAADTLDHTNSH